MPVVEGHGSRANVDAGAHGVDGGQEAVAELAGGLMAGGDGEAGHLRRSRPWHRSGGVHAIGDDDADSDERTVFSARYACPVSGFTIDEIEPRLFSFNNPYGACPSCDGLGNEMFFDAMYFATIS